MEKRGSWKREAWMEKRDDWIEKREDSLLKK
jgi:hypothetical protein